MRKNPEVDLKFRYRKVFEAATVIALGVLIVAFQVSKRLELKAVQRTAARIEIKMEDIPPTQQFKRPPPPARPAVPIETESEDVPEDVTIESTELDFTEVPPPPPPPKEDEEKPPPPFVPYDRKPEPIGGWAAIQRNLVYPEIARKAGVEGTVYVYAWIDKQGNVRDAKVIKSLGVAGCDEAAVNAIRAVKWKPAMQRDKPVAVWVSIPVKFVLKDTGR